MSPNDILRTRIAASVVDLDRVAARMKLNFPAGSRYERAAQDLLQRISNIRRELKDDEKAVADSGAIEASWVAFTTRRIEAESVVEECRALPRRSVLEYKSRGLLSPVLHCKQEPEPRAFA